MVKEGKFMLRRVILLVILCCAGTLSACRTAQPAQPAPVDATPRLVVMSAFDAELAQLNRRLQRVAQTYAIGGRSYTTGRLAGREVVLVLSGTSMVNAALTAQAAIDHFKVTGIIFSGIAGGVNPDLQIGDVVIPAQWGEYQEQVFARGKGSDWDTGTFPREFGNFGMMFPQKVGVTHEGGALDGAEQRFWFPVSVEMLAAARQVSGRFQLKSCLLKIKCLERQPAVVVGGNGVSGPTFVDNAAYRQWVWQTFKADALDMESAAVAHVAYVNGVPFIAFRSLSDLAGGGPGGNEIATFFLLAAGNSASVVEEFLKQYRP
jgi:adenosylhomocysteine nucleosidase